MTTHLLALWVDLTRDHAPVVVVAIALYGLCLAGYGLWLGYALARHVRRQWRMRRVAAELARERRIRALSYGRPMSRSEWEGRGGPRDVA